MSQLAIIAADLIAISVLVFALYFPRYQRTDMVVAILGLNVGVMAAATALASSDVSAGLGLGLFGVLSIIRLRSSELAQEEVAYYFSSLALGLIAGFAIEPLWVGPALMAMVVLTLCVGDHPRLFAGNRHQVVNLDAAYTDEDSLITRLEALLSSEILKVNVQKVDLVNDTTTVDVRFSGAATSTRSRRQLHDDNIVSVGS